MIINCTVQFTRPDENLNDLSQDEAASAIINALGGDEELDYCVVFTQQMQGTAGTPPVNEPFIIQGPDQQSE